MPASNHVFQSFWYGDTVSPYEKMCMKSFIDHGHAFHLYAYSPQLEVPSGVKLRDAAEIIDKSQHFTRAKGKGSGSHAPFADVFRYKLIAQRGGWWVDMDVVCLSAEIPNFEEFFARHSRLVNNAVLLFQRADPIMWDCFNEAARIRDGGRWCETGPHLITRKLEENDRILAAQPNSTCYPVSYRDVFDLLRPAQASSLANQTRDSLFLHLYNEVFRSSNVCKTMLPPRGSLLRKIADRHPVEGWSGEYDADFLEHTLNTETRLKQLCEENAALRRPLITAGRKAATVTRKFLGPLRSALVARLRTLKPRFKGTLASPARQNS